MGRKPLGSLAALVIIGTFIGIVIATIFVQRNRNVLERNKKYIFINETADHRFDESIRVSLLAAQKRTGVQNAVVITESGGDQDNLEVIAAKWFRQLEVGRATNGRGILYVFRPERHELKIEIGYALEGSLPDLRVAELERAAKSFTFSERYQDFWAELINTLNIEIERSGETDSFPIQFQYLSGGAGISSDSYKTDLKQLMLESRQSERNSLNGSSLYSSVESAIEAYLKALANGWSQPDQNILSPESQIFRRLIPQTSFQLYRNWRMMETAGIDRVFELEDFAFVFYKPGHPVLPLVLKKNPNFGWQIVEPLSWSLFQRFEDSNQLFLKFPISGLPKEVVDYFERRLSKPLYPQVCEIPFRELKRSPPEADDVIQDYFHLYALDEVIKRFGRSEEKSLSNCELVILTDALMNSGQMSEMVKAYRALADRVPENQTLRRNARFYEKTFSFDDREWRLRF